MKTCHRNNLGALITERLAEIGAANIPAGARELLEADVWRSCARVVQRSVTAPRVGRAVARALAATAAEGSKGAVAPLASSGFEPKAQNHVAGPATVSEGIQDSDTASAVNEATEGANV
jgi:hypothetical protein